jgi:hypothetical protein
MELNRLGNNGRGGVFSGSRDYLNEADDDDDLEVIMASALPPPSCSPAEMEEAERIWFGVVWWWPIINKAIATGQRARLLRDQEVLDQSSDRLARAQRLAQQNEEIGIAILDELGDQRETLKRAYDKVLTTSPPPTLHHHHRIVVWPSPEGGKGPFAVLTFALLVVMVVQHRSSM